MLWELFEEYCVLQRRGLQPVGHRDLDVDEHPLGFEFLADPGERLRFPGFVLEDEGAGKIVEDQLVDARRSFEIDGSAAELGEDWDEIVSEKLDGDLGDPVLGVVIDARQARMVIVQARRESSGRQKKCSQKNP